MIYPDLSYNQALFVSGLEKLFDRRLEATRNVFNGLKKPDNVLSDLLASCRISNVTERNKDRLRNNYPYKLPRAKTSRLNRSFLAFYIKNRF